jgi:hypothetical protein
MRRALVVCPVALVLMTFLLVLAPAAGAAMPPQGAWAWPGPYQPATPLAAFQLTAVGPSGSVYVAGDEYPEDLAPMIVARVDAAGQELWSKSVPGPEALGVVPHALATDAKRNLIVAGACNAGQGDVYVVKFRAGDGAVLWQRRWNNPTVGGDDVAYSVAVDRYGNVYVVGHTETANGMTDAIVRTYDATGHLKWKYTLGTSRYDWFFACGLDRYGYLYVTGEYASDPGSSKLVTLKLGPDGHKVWQRTIAGLGVSYGGRYLRVRGTSVTVVGALWVNGLTPVILRYTLSGKQTWATAWGPAVDEIRDMTVEGKGRVVLVGTKTVSPGGQAEITAGFLQVYKPGELFPNTSTTFYGDWVGAMPAAAGFNSVAVDSTGRMYCGGWLDAGPVAAGTDAIVVRYPSVDTLAWPGADAMWRLNGPGAGLDVFSSVLRVSDTAVYAAGKRAGTGGAEAILQKISLSAGT